MPYPRDQLGKGEDIILDFHPHWTYLIRPFAWTALWLAALGGLVWLLRNREGASLKLVVLGAIVVAWAATAGVDFLRWRTTEYVLTTDRLIVREGIVAKRGQDIPLENINDIKFSQNVLERVVGSGDLVIESAGEYGQSHYTDIPKPNVVRNEIGRAMEENRNRMMRGGLSPDESSRVATPTGDAGIPIPKQIEELARLRDQGLISEAEFQAKKTELLRRM